VVRAREQRDGRARPERAAPVGGGRDRLREERVALARERPRAAFMHRRRAGERREHAVRVRRLRHRAVERRLPARVVLGVALATRLGADVVLVAQLQRARGRARRGVLRLRRRVLRCEREREGREREGRERERGERADRHRSAIIGRTRGRAARGGG
jgi:hypothetical protein